MGTKCTLVQNERRDETQRRRKHKAGQIAEVKMSPTQKHAINKKLVVYWREKMLFWLLRQEFYLKQDTLDEMATNCAFDAMNSMPEYLAKLHRELLDLGATEEEIANPGFLNPPPYRGPKSTGMAA